MNMCCFQVVTVHRPFACVQSVFIETIQSPLPFFFFFFLVVFDDLRRHLVCSAAAEGGGRMYPIAINLRAESDLSASVCAHAC